MIRKFLSPAAKAVGALGLLTLGGCNMALLNPKGDIAEQERFLILAALGVMLLVVIPVIVLTLFFAWRYRASNTKATYAPNWSHSTAIEIVVWTIPCIIVAALGVLIWQTTHSLDPYKPLASKEEPVRVQVVALNWKWLFIYPDYGVASVNKLELPVNRPVNFTITSESIMNSFFIPQLGSQIYAMAGMQTQLHLIARSPGVYQGMSASFSGPGFADMHFDAVAETQQGFDAWVRQAKKSQLALDNGVFQTLAKPSEKNPVAIYGDVAPGLFDTIANKNMPAAGSNSSPIGRMARADKKICRTVAKAAE